jgi:hypothetical protein
MVLWIVTHLSSSQWGWLQTDGSNTTTRKDNEVSTEDDIEAIDLFHEFALGLL